MVTMLMSYSPLLIFVTGFVKTVPIGTTIEIHLWLNIKATLLYCQAHQAHGYR